MSDNQPPSPSGPSGGGPLSGHKALITGAAGGIGLAAARALAQTGADLYISGRSEDALEQVALSVREDFAINVEIHIANPSNPVDAEVLAIASDDAKVFVSCSGNLPQGNINVVDESKWKRSWEAAVFAPVNLIREMWTYMYETPHSLMIIVIDASMVPDPEDVCASSAGGALMALVEALGKANRYVNGEGAPRVLGLVTGRNANAANVGAVISRMACEPEHWESGTLLSVDAFFTDTKQNDETPQATES
ncbi:MAG: SDR family NAD(P)-dependent oxidoreductase [Rhodospirillaceae bacterium]|nr:SDR family NAD(P)-dependent oxidoreductase [Rhodospirillaceae bacterium]